MRKTPLRSCRWGPTALVAALLLPSNASATYSIVALDLKTGEVGAAVTSCVGTLSVLIVIGSAPGKGIVAAQAAANQMARDRAVMLLMEGTSAPDIIADITAPGYDFLQASRQYAVIDAQGMAAGFTGASTMEYADDIQGNTGDFAYSVQGNILTGPEVLTQVAQAFETQGCDLAEKLLLALEAGAQGGAGDSRCTPDGIPSDSAAIQVDPPDMAAGSFLQLDVTDTKPSSPLPLLRAEFDAWRMQHPCSREEPAPDAGTSDPVDGGAMPSAGSGGSSMPSAGSGGESAVAGAGAASGSGATVKPIDYERNDASGCSTLLARGDHTGYGSLLAVASFCLGVSRFRRKR